MPYPPDSLMALCGSYLKDNCQTPTQKRAFMLLRKKLSELKYAENADTFCKHYYYSQKNEFVQLVVNERVLFKYCPALFFISHPDATTVTMPANRIRVDPDAGTVRKVEAFGKRRIRRLNEVLQKQHEGSIGHISVLL